MKSLLFLTALVSVLGLSLAGAQPPSGSPAPVVIAHGLRDRLEEFYDYRIVVEAFRRAGYPVEVVEVAWPRALDMARTGRADGLCNTLVTAERQEFLVFPREPLVQYQQSLFAPRNRAPAFTGDLRTLEGLTIGVVRGFSYGPDFDARVRAGSLSVYECADAVQLGKMLLAGRVDVAVENPLALHHEMRTVPGFWKAVVELGPPVTSLPAYVAFSKKGPRAAELAAAFDKALGALKRDGTYQRILADSLAP